MRGGCKASGPHIEIGIHQQLGHPEHAIHRGSNFVTHGGQKFALGLARLLGGLLGG